MQDFLTTEERLKALLPKQSLIKKFFKKMVASMKYLNGLFIRVLA